MKNEKAVVTTTKTQMVTLFKTSYHYYRNWVKYILADGKINKFSFTKDENGWHGTITVDKDELEKAKSILKDYQNKNPETTLLWW